MDVVGDRAVMFSIYIKKFYTENLESKVLVNENFCKLIYEQFKHVSL
jgi:hypothetical protein